MEDNRQIHSQEGHRSEPTKETLERKTPENPGAHKDGRVEGETAHATGSEIHCSNNGQVQNTGR